MLKILNEFVARIEMILSLLNQLLELKRVRERFSFSRVGKFEAFLSVLVACCRNNTPSIVVYVFFYAFMYAVAVLC